MRKQILVLFSSANYLSELYEQGAFPHPSIEGGKLDIILDPVLLYVPMITEEDSRHIFKTS